MKPLVTSPSKRIGRDVSHVQARSRKPPPSAIPLTGVNANAYVGLDTPVDFGKYELVAGAPDYRPWRETVEVKEEGKVTTIVIDLQRMQP